MTSTSTQTQSLADLTAQMRDAINSDNIEALRECLESGGNPNLLDVEGWAPIHWACMRAYDGKKYVDLLLEYGADVNLPGEHFDTTALGIAAYSIIPEIMASLIKAGADLDRLDSLGLAPLHQIIQGVKHSDTPLPNVLDAWALLLEAGADINVKNNDGQTPLECAPEPLRKQILAWEQASKARSVMDEVASVPPGLKPI